MTGPGSLAGTSDLPLPPFYRTENVVNDARWIDYLLLQETARQWRTEHGIPMSHADQYRIGLLIIDAQNTFCHPRGELFVGGMSGTGAVDDCIRTVEFIYRNLAVLTRIHCTLDTHRSFAVFHPAFLIGHDGNHPAPYTTVTNDDLRHGVWRPSPLLVSALGITETAARRQLEHYTTELERRGRYSLTVWPYHGMAGDKGHAVVSGIIEAVNFHGFVRGAQPVLEAKGTNPWVENYSILGPEVTTLATGDEVPRNAAFIQSLMDYDAVIIMGQAKSHCVEWSIQDILQESRTNKPEFVNKIYIVEDCMTPIVVKDPATGKVVFDYTPGSQEIFEEFRQAGMHLVRSTTPIREWPGIGLPSTDRGQCL